MKIFISWSGTLSRQVAELLSSWLTDVLQGAETWLSTDDIDKGAIWFGDISGQLAETTVGILCLTRDNKSAPWVLFEAGALSKGLSKSRVCPFLVDLEHTDLQPPLSQFNGTLPNRDDLLKLLKTINAESLEKSLSDEKLSKAFNRWWDEFELKFAEILKHHKPRKQPDKRSVEDMVEEILEISRSLQQKAQRSGPEVRSVYRRVDPTTGKTELVLKAPPTVPEAPATPRLITAEELLALVKRAEESKSVRPTEEA